jgi:hypothetical protein
MIARCNSIVQIDHVSLPACQWIFLLVRNMLQHMSISFVWTYVFISFEFTPRSGITGLYGYSRFKLLRSCQSVFQSNWIILQSHQQYYEGSLSPYCSWHLWYLSFWLYMVTLMYVKWYLIASFHVLIGHLYIFFGELFTLQIPCFSLAWWLTSAIPSTQEADIGRMAVWGQPGQKVRHSISTNNPGVVVHSCDPSYMESCRY